MGVGTEVARAHRDSVVSLGLLVGLIKAQDDAGASALGSLEIGLGRVARSEDHRDELSSWRQRNALQRGAKLHQLLLRLAVLCVHASLLDATW